VHSAGTGVVLTLIATPEDRRDPRLSDIAREMVIRTITTAEPSTTDGDLAAHAVALTELVRGGEPAVLSAAERGLLTEWLTRLADAH
jgi:hypothetical protein